MKTMNVEQLEVFVAETKDTLADLHEDRIGGAGMFSCAWASRDQQAKKDLKEAEEILAKKKAVLAAGGLDYDLDYNPDGLAFFRDLSVRFPSTGCPMFPRSRRPKTAFRRRAIR